MKVADVLAWLEIAGGSRPLPERWRGDARIAVLRAVVWVLFFLLAWSFAGRTTKFVYVDF